MGSRFTLPVLLLLFREDATEVERPRFDAAFDFAAAFFFLEAAADLGLTEPNDLTRLQTTLPPTTEQLPFAAASLDHRCVFFVAITVHILPSLPRLRVPISKSQALCRGPRLDSLYFSVVLFRFLLDVSLQAGIFFTFFKTDKKNSKYVDEWM